MSDRVKVGTSKVTFRVRAFADTLQASFNEEGE